MGLCNNDLQIITGDYNHGIHDDRDKTGCSRCAERKSTATEPHISEEKMPRFIMNNPLWVLIKY